MRSQSVSVFFTLSCFAKYFHELCVTNRCFLNLAFYALHFLQRGRELFSPWLCLMCVHDYCIWKLIVFLKCLWWRSISVSSSMLLYLARVPGAKLFCGLAITAWLESKRVKQKDANTVNIHRTTLFTPAIFVYTRMSKGIQGRATWKRETHQTQEKIKFWISVTRGRILWKGKENMFQAWSLEKALIKWRSEHPHLSTKKRQLTALHDRGIVEEGFSKRGAIAIVGSATGKDSSVLVDQAKGG